MRLRPEPVQIGPEDGFKPELDLFGYSRFGHGLANLVGRLEGPSALVLHGPWGSGKSVFAKQWAGVLRKRKIDVVAFNALESDHGDDPFVVLAGKLLEFAKLKRLSVADRLHESSEEMAANLFPLTANLLVKVLSGGLLEAKDLVLETRNVLQDRIKQAEGMPAAVDQFRDNVREMAHELLIESDRTEGEGSTGLVVIIDELDRCRPVFALSCLERIRHLFSVPGLCFVLVTDLRQIERAVEKEYGLSGTDARVFLQKYYDRHFNLQGSTAQSVEHTHSVVESERYVSYLWDGLSLGSNEDVFGNWRQGELAVLATVHRLDFRRIEQVITNMNLFAMTIDKSFQYWYQMLCAMSVMRIVSPELYSRAKRGTLTPKDVSPFMKYEVVSSYFSKEKADRFQNTYLDMWHFALAQSEKGAIQRDANQSLYRSLAAPIATMSTIGPAFPIRMVERICTYLDEMTPDQLGQ